MQILDDNEDETGHNMQVERTAASVVVCSTVVSAARILKVI